MGGRRPKSAGPGAEPSRPPLSTALELVYARLRQEPFYLSFAEIAELTDEQLLALGVAAEEQADRVSGAAGVPAAVEPRTDEEKVVQTWAVLTALGVPPDHVREQLRKQGFTPAQIG